MDFLFGKEHQMIQGTVQKFLGKDWCPIEIVWELDEKDEFSMGIF